ncbi:hypothetical protein K504DRAFT_454251 [Pleomassaria siparia CBS 279.74]|uniref:Uncharacterized protein n=1 Tax=Pleomassaria siparia CBS 279.74 TaxID=1314801 RepID=A0A6G1JPT3_9PLEO|nr:hypothetical protein K504DRAFT_454251 [Pleomassaria siparia CBS 279.74]
METDNNKGHGLSSLSSAPVTAGKEPDHERLTGGQVLDPKNIRSQQPISTPTSATAVHGLASQGRPSAEYPSGQGLQGNLTSRVISNPPQPPGFLSGVNQLSLGLEAPGLGLEGRRVGQPSSTRDQMRARKMQRDTLIGMRDPPRLNGDRPTAAEVEQWIKDLNMALRTNECGLDTYHRIVWVISLLLGNGLRDLINSAVQSGEITTLAQLLARVTSETLFTRIARQTKDAGYIKFDNAMPFYNCVWRTPDTWAAFNAFMTTQGDSINPHPFRHPDGTWQHLPMIYFVWSKLPVAIQ